MRIKKFTFNPFQENTYIVSNDADECFIVDPGCSDKNEEKILSDFIESNNLRPVALINTHCHIDHVFGNAYVSDTYDLTPIIHQEELPVLKAVPQVAHLYRLNYNDSPEPIYYQGDVFTFGEGNWDVIHCPGHSPGHVVLYQKDSGILLGGDVLFRMSIGRTDLPGGNHQDLIHSINTKIFSLPGETRVLPGHMEETTVEFEKRHNPFLT